MVADRSRDRLRIASVRPRLSISLRLTLWFSAIFLCGFLTFGGLMVLGLTTSVNNSRDQKLKRRAEHAIEVFKRAQNDASGVSQKTKGNFIVPTPERAFASGVRARWKAPDYRTLLRLHGFHGLPFPPGRQTLASAQNSMEISIASMFLLRR